MLNQMLKIRLTQVMLQKITPITFFTNLNKTKILAVEKLEHMLMHYMPAIGCVILELDGHNPILIAQANIATMTIDVSAVPERSSEFRAIVSDVQAAREAAKEVPKKVQKIVDEATPREPVTPKRSSEVQAAREAPAERKPGRPRRK